MCKYVCTYLCTLIIKIYVSGLYTPTKVEKRWNYLKDCYRKARNAFKKLQSFSPPPLPKKEVVQLANQKMEKSNVHFVIIMQ